MALARSTTYSYLAGFILVVVVLVGVAVLWATGKFLGPLPPRHVVMTTGPQGSSYQAFATQYQKILAREGIELRLVPSLGAVENLERLRDPRAEALVGFVLGGTTNEQESPDLISLGTVFYEPLWIFYRGPHPSQRPGGYKGWRVSIEPRGSGTRRLMEDVLAMHQISEKTVELHGLTPEDAAEQLLQGRLDALAMMATWESPLVQRLLASEQLSLLSIRRADATVALRPFLHKLVVPEGVASLQANRPPTDVVLVGPKTSLAARQDLHPAIQTLLLEAAREVHGKPGMFHQLNEFPAPESVDLPLSMDARNFYTSGQPFLQRYLPFWMAIFVARIALLLIPIVAVIYPLIRAIPKLWDWLMHRRLRKAYRELRSIEVELAARAAAQPVKDLIERLDALESSVTVAWVPLAYSDRYYILRQHVQLVHGLLEHRRHDQSKGLS